MKKMIFLSLVLMLLLGACNIPSATQSQVDFVATQVAKNLTNIAAQPTERATQLPLTSPTEAPHELEHTPTETATDTPVPTDTPAPTETPTPTATTDQTDPAVQLGTPTWVADFDAGNDKWEDDFEQSKFSIANGYYNIVSKQTPYWNSWYFLTPKIKNFYAEMTFDMPTCSGKDRIGLAFRSPDYQEFYFIGITCDGNWGFDRYSKAEGIINIVSYAATSALKPADQVNRAGVWAKDGTFEFYINGVKVGQASDNTHLDEGSIGFVSRFIDKDGFTTRVDKLQYWSLP